MLLRTRFLGTFALLLGAIVPAIFINPNPAQAQNRHVFIEEFTGNWCGWCPRGIWGIEQLKAKYGNKVIAVAIHGGSQTEPMQTTVGNQLMAGMAAPLNTQTIVNSFPNSWINREVFTTTGQSGTYQGWDIDPSYWTASDNSGVVDSMVDKPALATVSISNLSFDPTTRLMTATVKGTFLAAMSGDFRFSMYVTEDSVFGPPGSNYDQHNYYSGTTYDPTNPWTDSASVVPGYHHMHVVRAILGGAWGTGSFPSTVSSGMTDSQTFTYTVPASMNPANMHVIGTLHEFNSSDINGNVVFDAAEVPLTNLPVLPLSMRFAGGSYLTVAGNAASPQALIVTNQAASSATVTLKASPVVGYAPAGWTATLGSTTLTIPAHGSDTVLLNVTSPSNAGFVWDTITAFPTAEGYVASNMQTMVNMLSNNTQFAVFGNPETGPEAVAMNSWPSTYKNSAAVLPATDSVIGNYLPENFQLAVFSDIPYVDYDPTGSIPPVGVPPLMSHINAILSAGKKVLITSDEGVFFALDPSSPYSTSDGQNFFQNTLQLSYTASQQRYNTSTGAAKSYSITGTSDPISTGFKLTGSGGVAGGYYITTSTFSVNAGSPSIPVFYSDGDTSATNSVRYEDPTAHGRLVYLGFDLATITSQSEAGKVFANSINWLMSSAGVNPTPQPSTSSITASPNPFHGMTQVQYTAAPGERDVTLAAYDVLGREVAKLAATNSGNVYSANFDGSKLANGTYLIIAHSSAGTHQVQVVDQQ